MALQHWLLRYGNTSLKLRETIAQLTEWIANNDIPWAAIHGLTLGRLIAIPKSGGQSIRPIGIGESWRRIMSKCIIRETGIEAQIACSKKQLCSGIPCGIESAIHVATEFINSFSNDSPDGFIKIDANNAFNECNRHSLMWTLRHEWPS